MSSVRASGRKLPAPGVALLPMFFFVALALGFLVVGQTVSALAKVGAISYLGSTMVIVVVRELGPLLAAFLVLARVGTAHVIELGTARALGEVEALERFWALTRCIILSCRVSLAWRWAFFR